MDGVKMDVKPNETKLHLLVFTQSLLSLKFHGGAQLRFTRLTSLLACKNVRIRTFSIRPLLMRSRLLALYLELIRLVYFSVLAVRRERIDLIYLHMHHYPEDVIPAYVVSRITGRPLAIVFHHLVPEDRLSLSLLLRVRVAKGFTIISAAFRTLLDVMTRGIYRRADLCIAVSKSTAKDLSKFLHVKKLVVVGNGVDLDRFVYDIHAQKHYEAAFLGRITPDKGVRTLLQSWKIVISKFPKARLVLIGGPDWRLLGSESKALGLEDHVVVTGFVSPSEVPKLLNSSLIFVFPSWSEGFSIATAEAMACGLPCVISDIPALRENFSDVALFVDPKDIEGFAKAIIDLLSDEEQRRRFGEKGARFVQRFSWERIAATEHKVLLNLLQHRKRKNQVL